MALSKGSGFFYLGISFLGCVPVHGVKAAHTVTFSSQKGQKRAVEDKQLPLKNVTRALNRALLLTPHWSESSHMTILNCNGAGNYILYLDIHVPFQNCGESGVLLLKGRKK